MTLISSIRSLEPNVPRTSDSDNNPDGDSVIYDDTANDLEDAQPTPPSTDNPATARTPSTTVAVEEDNFGVQQQDDPISLPSRAPNRQSHPILTGMFLCNCFMPFLILFKVISATNTALICTRMPPLLHAKQTMGPTIGVHMAAVLSLSSLTFCTAGIKCLQEILISCLVFGRQVLLHMMYHLLFAITEKCTRLLIGRNWET